MAPDDGAEMARVLAEYLDAFGRRDVAACVQLYAEDAVVHFMMQTVTGSPQIRRWHEERFANALQVAAADQVRVTGTVARLDLMVSSERMRAWRIAHFRTRGMFRFDCEHRITEAKFILARPVFVPAAG